MRYCGPAEACGLRLLLVEPHGFSPSLG
jgi:hypothetical protein